jgi:hypothetical protein
VYLLDLEAQLLGIRGPCVMTKDAAPVVGVVEFGAVGADTGARPEKEFCCEQHAESWREEINPKRVPIAAAKG